MRAIAHLQGLRSAGKPLEITAQYFDIKHPAVDDMTLRPSPAADLNDCYQIGRRGYNKSRVKRTINALDTTVIRGNVKNRIKELKNLVNTIESFLNPPVPIQTAAAAPPAIANAEPASKV
ncbi:hypothetical protein [Paraburkholderia sediminicola]|uniref:hypothetical protein n=1 Tax=Paraburkholderia sediminicola TaxID=458836 RepID=UPI0038B827D0